MFGMGRSPAREASRRGWTLHVDGNSPDTEKTSGTMTFAGGTTTPPKILIDANAHFQSEAVEVGEKVASDVASSTVVSVDSETQLTLAASIMDDAIAQGETDGVEAFKLIDSLATFESSGVTPGFIVVNPYGPTFATVVALDPVTPETKLTLSADNFALGSEYYIYEPVAYSISYKRTGASWPMSYLTVQNALAGVISSTKEIKVAGATGAGQTYLTTPTATRTIYHLALAGVDVIGGYAGYEIRRASNDPETYLTTLSGNVSGTEGTNGSYHVVSTNEAALASPSTWRGFTIRGGVCDGSTAAQRRGGGVSSLGGLILVDCKIINCKGATAYADAQPSGIYADANSGFQNVSVDNCTLGSSAVYIKNVTNFDGITVTNCTCSNSSASRVVKIVESVIDGRRLIVADNPSGSGGNTYALVINLCDGKIDGGLITDNVAGGVQGSGVVAHVVDLDHFTVTRNAIVGTGGGVRQNGAGQVINLKDSIVYNNTATVADDNMSAGVAGNLTATYSDCQGGFAGSHNIDVDPTFVAPTDAIGPDLIWNTEDDGLIPTAEACIGSADDGVNMGFYRGSL